MNRMERAMLCHSADPEYRVWEQETDPEATSRCRNAWSRTRRR